LSVALDHWQVGAVVQHRPREMVTGVVGVQRGGQSDEVGGLGFGVPGELLDDEPDGPGAEPVVGAAAEAVRDEDPRAGITRLTGAEVLADCLKGGGIEEDRAFAIAFTADVGLALVSAPRRTSTVRRAVTSSRRRPEQ
jgi:hypothetical protein